MYKQFSKKLLKIVQVVLGIHFIWRFFIFFILSFSHCFIRFLKKVRELGKKGVVFKKVSLKRGFKKGV